MNTYVCMYLNLSAPILSYYIVCIECSWWKEEAHYRDCIYWFLPRKLEGECEEEEEEEVGEEERMAKESMDGDAIPAFLSPLPLPRRRNLLSFLLPSLLRSGAFSVYVERLDKAIATLAWLGRRKKETHRLPVCLPLCLTVSSSVSLICLFIRINICVQSYMYILCMYVST